MLASVESVSGRPLLSVVVALAITAVACGSGGDAAAPARPAGGNPTTTTAPAPTDSAPTTTATTAPATPPLTRPDWLGTRVLNPVPGEPPPPTPPELDPRILPTVDALPPPADGGFHAAVQPVPADVVARSTWQEACPVTLDELRYVTLSFWGFDDTAHTGEIIVHRDAADAVVRVFEQLFAERFPIEDMQVSSMADLDAPNTGDGNTTAAFVCRPTRGSSKWSEHAYGLAVDVDPFQNPYVRDGGVIPSLAGSYLDRANVRPGMLEPGTGPVAAFAAIGWGWGGEWENPRDYMHFSASGR
jgi:D-alanyl-D-alanine carboxypeptidase